MTNIVILSGNLGDAPELKHTKANKPFAVFDIATTEFFSGPEGKQEHTEWTRIEVWNNRAKPCAEILTKGSTVLVEGKLFTNKWETEDGETKSFKVVRASKVEFIHVKK